MRLLLVLLLVQSLSGCMVLITCDASTKVCQDLLQAYKDAEKKK